MNPEAIRRIRRRELVGTIVKVLIVVGLLVGATVASVLLTLHFTRQ